jgi:uracil-DNA glycosylase family protein
MTSAADFLPENRTLKSLREAAAHCRGCELYRNATQTVFGAGALRASAFFVGEQPGDAEDRAGEPFVGPAGRLLDEGLEAAGIDRRTVYVTNAVKHFKNEPRGKRRLHKKPSMREVAACRPWLLAELAAVEPEVVVFLGATAAQALLGSAFRVTKARGEIRDAVFGKFLATVHPASILRAPDHEARAREKAAFFADLEVLARFLRSRERRGAA